MTSAKGKNPAFQTTSSFVIPASRYSRLHPLLRKNGGNQTVLCLAK